MMPKQHLQKFAARVTKRCGICQATVEQVLPAIFDEIRQMMVEEEYPCVPIDSFGTFSVIKKPARRYHYYRPSKGIDRWVDLPPKRHLKFLMAYNMRREFQEGKFDPTRKAFTRHPDDPIIRKRREMRYQKRDTREPIPKNTTEYFKEKK